MVPGLNTRPFSGDEKRFISENLATMSRAQLARALKRSRRGIGNYLDRNGLDAHRPYIAWTKPLVDRLKVLSESRGHREIAQILGLPLFRVSNKLKELGLKTRSDVFSLRSAAAYTGYNPYQLLRAKAGLNQEWFKAAYRGKGARPMLRYRISYSQLEALCEYLKTEK